MFSIDRHQRELRLALAIELAHARDGVRGVVDGALHVFELARARRGSGRARFEQRFGVERDRREGVVDVVGDAAGHLAQRAQALLLHHRVLGLAQFVIGLLQRAVELGLIRGERDVLAQLAQEFAVAAARNSRAPVRATMSAPKTLALHLQRRSDEGPSPPRARRCGNGNRILEMSGS